jgi:hypothetical protein
MEYKQFFSFKIILIINMFGYKPTWVGLVLLVWVLEVYFSQSLIFNSPNVNFDRLVHTE